LVYWRNRTKWPTITTAEMHFMVRLRTVMQNQNNKYDYDKIS
jgi:hypothetical protein